MNLSADNPAERYGVGHIVRDRVPSLLALAGVHYRVRRITDRDEFCDELRAALVEKTAELREDGLVDPGLIEHLGDVLDICEELITAVEVNRRQLYDSRHSKHSRKGGYKSRLFLVSTSEAADEIKRRLSNAPVPKVVTPDKQEVVEPSLHQHVHQEPSIRPGAPAHDPSRRTA